MSELSLVSKTSTPALSSWTFCPVTFSMTAVQKYGAQLLPFSKGSGSTRDNSMDELSGPQKCYAEAIEDWSSHHDLLLHTNSHKNCKVVKDIVLRSQLLSRPPDLVTNVTTEQLRSRRGSTYVVHANLESDTLFLWSVFTRTSTTDNASHGAIESLQSSR